MLRPDSDHVLMVDIDSVSTKYTSSYSGNYCAMSVSTYIHVPFHCKQSPSERMVCSSTAYNIQYSGHFQPATEHPIDVDDSAAN